MKWRIARCPCDRPREGRALVLGTHFNINAYPDENGVKTTLLEGSVRVSHLSEMVLLRPGEQSSVDNSSAAIAVAEANVNDVVAWKNGFFSYSTAMYRPLCGSLPAGMM